MKRGIAYTRNRFVACERGGLSIGVSTMEFCDRLGMGGEGGCEREQLERQ